MQRLQLLNRCRALSLAHRMRVTGGGRGMPYLVFEQEAWRQLSAAVLMVGKSCLPHASVLPSEVLVAGGQWL